VQWPWQGAVLKDVAVVSADEAWAVGVVSPVDHSRPLVSHYIDHAFHTVRTPLTDHQGAFRSIALLGGRPVIVGYDLGRAGKERHPVALRRTHHGWRFMDTSAGDLPGGDFLSSVDVVSKANAWAVGTAHDGTTTIALVLHWNGLRWSRIHVPIQGLGGLLAVDASSDDVWAVPTIQRSSIGQPATVLRLAGGAWQVVEVPVPTGSAGAYYTSVAERGPNDVSLVGYALIETPNGYDQRTLTSHWDGSTWTSTVGPDAGGLAMYEGLAIGANRTALAVGYSAAAPWYQRISVADVGPTDAAWGQVPSMQKQDMIFYAAGFVPGTCRAFVVGITMAGEPIAFRSMW
jgi:hypothetical protein